MNVEAKARDYEACHPRRRPSLRRDLRRRNLQTGKKCFLIQLEAVFVKKIHLSQACRVGEAKILASFTVTQPTKYDRTFYFLPVQNFPDKATTMPPANSNANMSPKRDAVRRKAPPPPPCTRCKSFQHATSDCKLPAETVAEVQKSIPYCMQCGSLHSDDTKRCPHLFEDCARFAAHLHSIEPYARVVLKNGVPPTAPCCEKHYAMGHAKLTSTIGDVLQHRALMPLCFPCVCFRQSGFFDTRHSLDTCKFLLQEPANSRKLTPPSRQLRRLRLREP